MTKAQMLAALEGVESDTDVKFLAVGAIAANTVVGISTTLELDGQNVSRSVAPGGGDTVLVNPVVILAQA